MMDGIPHPDVETISEKYATLEPVLNERARRLWAATVARAIGRGRISRVAEAAGLSRITIQAGLSELRGAVGDEDGGSVPLRE